MKWCAWSWVCFFKMSSKPVYVRESISNFQAISLKFPLLHISEHPCIIHDFMSVAVNYTSNTKCFVVQWQVVRAWIVLDGNCVLQLSTYCSHVLVQLEFSSPDGDYNISLSLFQLSHRILVTLFCSHPFQNVVTVVNMYTTVFYLLTLLLTP